MEIATLTTIVKELGPSMALIAGMLWFVSKQVWPWVAARIDANVTFSQEVKREEIKMQRSLADSYQILATAFSQHTDWLKEIHARVVANDESK